MYKRPGANSENRYPRALGDRFAHSCRHTFHQGAERAGFFNQFGLTHDTKRRLGAPSLGFVAANLPGKLRRQPDMSHNQDT